MTERNVAVDALDRRIIGILQHHGRISWRELADAVHMASSSVADRVRRLEAAGIIRGIAQTSIPPLSGAMCELSSTSASRQAENPAEFEEGSPA